jgi:hypothetical protein
MTDEEWKRRYLALNKDISESEYDAMMAKRAADRAELDRQWAELQASSSSSSRIQGGANPQRQAAVRGDDQEREALHLPARAR